MLAVRLEISLEPALDLDGFLRDQIAGKPAARAQAAAASGI